MNKNIIIPLIIIIVGILIGGGLLLGNILTGRLNPSDNVQAELAQANLRKVDLEIKNMFCIGCRSSVVGSVIGLPGVVQADADPKTATGLDDI